MKIRNGFVSNSSSSSFVLVGTEINRNDIDEEFMQNILNKHDIPLNKWGDLEDTFWEAMYDGKFGVENPSETPYWGVELFSFDGEYIDEGSYSFEDIVKAGEEVKEKLTDFFGYTPEIKVYTGTKAC